MRLLLSLFACTSPDSAATPDGTTADPAGRDCGITTVAETYDREPARTCTWTYDADGALSLIVCDDGRSAAYSYPTDAQVVVLTDVGGNGEYVTEDQYDTTRSASGHEVLETSTDILVGTQSTHVFAFDADGRWVGEQLDHEADGVVDVEITLAYTFTEAGQVATRAWTEVAGGKTTSAEDVYTWTDGLLTERRYTSRDTEYTLTYAYDEDGLLTTRAGAYDTFSLDLAFTWACGEGAWAPGAPVIFEP